MSLPSGLSVADLKANLPCNWWRISLAKRGPKLTFACKFCHGISKTKTCPMLREPALSAPTASPAEQSVVPREDH